MGTNFQSITIGPKSPGIAHGVCRNAFGILQFVTSPSVLIFRLAQQLVEEKKRKAQPYGTEHLVEIMRILGYSPAQIQEEISQLDRMVQIARSMRS